MGGRKDDLVQGETEEEEEGRSGVDARGVKVGLNLTALSAQIAATFLSS